MSLPKHFTFSVGLSPKNLSCLESAPTSLTRRSAVNSSLRAWLARPCRQPHSDNIQLIYLSKRLHKALLSRHEGASEERKQSLMMQTCFMDLLSSVVIRFGSSCSIPEVSRSSWFLGPIATLNAADIRWWFQGSVAAKRRVTNYRCQSRRQSVLKCTLMSACRESVLYL